MKNDVSLIMMKVNMFLYIPQPGWVANRTQAPFHKFPPKKSQKFTVLIF